jgi:Putative zinc-finger
VTSTDTDPSYRVATQLGPPHRLAVAPDRATIRKKHAIRTATVHHSARQVPRPAEAASEPVCLARRVSSHGTAQLSWTARMPKLSRGDGCAQCRNELGVYVLGAIGPAERAQVDQHLTACPWCREELAGLAGLPGLLHRVPPDVAAQAWTDDSGEPVPGPAVDRLIHRVSVIQRQRRLTAAAAALVIGLAVATGLHVLQDRQASTTAATAPRWTDIDTGASATTRARATVRYAAQPWGTEMEARVTGIPAGTRCQLRVSNAQGQDIAAGGWTITAGSQQTWYPASVPWPAASLHGFVITAGSQTLVTVPAS